MENKYKLKSFDEVPMCVVVLSNNNIENNRYQKVLDTIKYQEYENYHIVFIDDVSVDDTL